MITARMMYKLSRYWRCYCLLIFATFLSLILIFISQKDPQLEYYFPYFKVGSKYYNYYFSNNGGDLSNLMENNTLEYDYMHSNSRVCVNAADGDEDESLEYRLVFLTLSQFDNYKARQAARQTYGKYLHKMNLKQIFFVGNPNFDKKTPSGADFQTKLDKEIKDYADIVQINMPDNENFTSAKTLISLRWSMIYCSVAQYLYVASDSAIVNHELLNNLLSKTNLFNSKHKEVQQQQQQSQVYEQWKHIGTINSSVISGFCNFTDEKLANALNTFYKDYVSKAKQQKELNTKEAAKRKQTASSTELYEGQYCSGLGWIVSKEAANKLWLTAFRSPYLVRIMPNYLTGYLGYKANLKYLNLFEYEDAVPLKSNCLKIFQQAPTRLLCAENFTMHNRYANYIATWNTAGQGQLVFSKL